MHVGIAYLRWRGKRSRHSQRMRTRDFAYLARGPWRLIETEMPKLKLGYHDSNIPNIVNYLFTKFNKGKPPFRHWNAKVMFSSLLACYLLSFTILASIFVLRSACLSLCQPVFLSVDVLVSWRFGLSTFRFVDPLVCRRYDVDASVCLCFDLLPMKLTYTTRSANSLAPMRWGNNFESAIFILILHNNCSVTNRVIVFRLMPNDL